MDEVIEMSTEGFWELMKCPEFYRESCHVGVIRDGVFWVDIAPEDATGFMFNRCMDAIRMCRG